MAEAKSEEQFATVAFTQRELAFVAVALDAMWRGMRASGAVYPPADTGCVWRMAQELDAYLGAKAKLKKEEPCLTYQAQTENA